MTGPNITRKVCLFLMFGVLLIAYLLFLFTKLPTLFRSYYEISMRTGYVGELRPGASVLMSGFQVGNVQSINLEPDLRSAMVKFRIIEQYKVRKNSLFTIEQRGILGEQYVAIYPTNSVGVFLQDGDIVECTEVIDFLNTARLTKGMAKKITETGENIENVLKRSQRVFNTDTFNTGEKVAKNFKQSIISASSTFREIKRLIDTNKPYADQIDLNSEKVITDWNKLFLDYSHLTNRIDLFIDNSKLYVDEIETNIQSGKTLIRSEKKDRIGEVAKGIDPEELKKKISRLATKVDTLNKFSSNLNSRGLIDAMKE